MRITTESGDIFQAKFDGIVLFTYEEPSDAEIRFTAKCGGGVGVARRNKEFEGKPKQLWMEKSATNPRFCLLVGLGKKVDVKPETIRNAAAVAGETLRNAGAKEIGIVVPNETSITAQSLVEGILLRTYQFNKYKTQKLDEIRELKTVTLLSENAETKKGVELGEIIAESCNYVRDLQNTPSIDMTPQIMAEAAAKIAKEEKLRCSILDKRQLFKQGYGGILSVGKGSTHEPRLVTIEYNPKGASKTIALVGKGITFDTGGISIKPSSKMSDMKFDMSGAANVLGIIKIASKLKLPVRVIGILCLAENMPDGNSYKPGDVVRTKSGKTIEIDNTDAEGRVALADGLHYATSFKPNVIIDMATLTGACVVALGDSAAGALTNNQTELDKLIAASNACAEKIWQLPMWDEYAEDIKSSIADMKNVGVPGSAGTISAAMMLKEFVGETPWIHLDIAGVAWAQGRERYFTPNGGSAFGVRLISEYLRNL